MGTNYSLFVVIYSAYWEKVLKLGQEEDETMNEKFSENLKRVRQDARMTQAEVAKIVGVAKNTYCNWELGTREPNILKIKALAKLFGVSVDYLVGFEKQDAFATAQNKYGKERVLAYLDALDKLSNGET